MAMFNVQKVIAFGVSQENRPLVVNGAVTIESKIGNDWVRTDRLSTGSYGYYTKGLVLRFTPDSGSSYDIDED